MEPIIFKNTKDYNIVSYWVDMIKDKENQLHTNQIKKSRSSRCNRQEYKYIKIIYVWF